MEHLDFELPDAGYDSEEENNEVEDDDQIMEKFENCTEALIKSNIDRIWVLLHIVIAIWGQTHNCTVADDTVKQAFDMIAESVNIKPKGLDEDSAEFDGNNEESHENSGHQMQSALNEDFNPGTRDHNDTSIESRISGTEQHFATTRADEDSHMSNESGSNASDRDKVSKQSHNTGLPTSTRTSLPKSALVSTNKMAPSPEATSPEPKLIRQITSPVSTAQAPQPKRLSELSREVEEEEEAQSMNAFSTPTEQAGMRKSRAAAKPLSASSSRSAAAIAPENRERNEEPDREPNQESNHPKDRAFNSGGFAQKIALENSAQHKPAEQAAQTSSSSKQEDISNTSGESRLTSIEIGPRPGSLQAFRAPGRGTNSRGRGRGRGH